MRNLVYLVGALAALACAGRVPCATAQLNDICVLTATHVNAAVEAEAGQELRSMDGYRGAEELTVTGSDTAEGPCHDMPGCTAENTDTNEQCGINDASIASGCCVQVYAKRCATCDTELILCGQFCFPPTSSADSSRRGRTLATAACMLALAVAALAH